MQVILHRAEVPKQALPRHLHQEGAVVLALAPAHAIYALAPGVWSVTGSYGRTERQAG